MSRPKKHRIVDHIWLINKYRISIRPLERGWMVSTTDPDGNEVSTESDTLVSAVEVAARSRGWSETVIGCDTEGCNKEIEINDAGDAGWTQIGESRYGKLYDATGIAWYCKEHSR